MVCLLCLTILFIQYRHSEPVSPQSIDVSQVETLPEESPSQSPTQPLPPADQEPVSVEWTNYTPGKLEQRQLDESIPFILRNYAPDVGEVFILASRKSSMDPIKDKKNVKTWLKGYTGKVPLKDLGIGKGIWYLQVLVQTPDEKITSKLRGIEIVGQ